MLTDQPCDDQSIIIECRDCKTKNRIPNPPRMDGTYRCSSCKRPLQAPQTSESETANDAATPTEEYQEAASERQIKTEAAKEAAVLSLFPVFLVLLFIPKIFSGVSDEGRIGLVVFLGLLLWQLWRWLYDRKLERAKGFIARVNRIRELVSNEQVLQAKREITDLNAPLKVLVGLRSQVLGAVQRVVEKHDRLLAEEQKQNKEEQERKIRKELFNQIHSQEVFDSISPEDFESLVLEVFTRQGYDARPTPRSGDEGIDGILVKHGKKTAVQCKKYKGTVGQPYLRDFLGAMLHAKCEEGIFVTTSDFSDKARAFAKDKTIRLVDGREIMDILRRTITEDFVLNGQLVKFPPKAEEKTCPSCGSRLKKILGRNGFFLGCSNFPKCRYTENVSTGLRFHRRGR